MLRQRVRRSAGTAKTIVSCPSASISLKVFQLLDQGSIVPANKELEAVQLAEATSCRRSAGTLDGRLEILQDTDA
jgi:hypothetical protein